MDNHLIDDTTGQVNDEPLAACQRCKLVGIFKHQLPLPPCECFNCIMTSMTQAAGVKRGNATIGLYQPPAFKKRELLCGTCAVGLSCLPVDSAQWSVLGEPLRQAMLYRLTPEKLEEFDRHRSGSGRRDTYQVSRATVLAVLSFLADQPSQEVLADTLARQRADQPSLDTLARQSADIEKVQSW